MKKFLLRVKGEEAELASVLPLINAVLEQHEDNQVAIVYTDTLEIEDFWLPERCWAYPISKKETESMFAAHKFAANLYDVFNTDYYFDFVNDMYSAALGLAFRADVKIGLQGGAKSFFYQISLERFVGEYLDEQKVSALSSIEGDYKITKRFSSNLSIGREFQRRYFKGENIFKKDDLKTEMDSSTFAKVSLAYKFR